MPKYTGAPSKVWRRDMRQTRSTVVVLSTTSEYNIDNHNLTNADELVGSGTSSEKNLSLVHIVFSATGTILFSSCFTWLDLGVTAH